MKYYKNTENGYITSVSTAIGEIEVTEDEYNAIINLIKTKPEDGENYIYMLNATTMRWNKVNVEPIGPVSEDAEEGDFISALEDLGVNFND